MLGLCCCSGFSLVAVCGLLNVVASLVAEHGLWVRMLSSSRHEGYVGEASGSQA